MRSEAAKSEDQVQQGEWIPDEWLKSESEPTPTLATDAPVPIARPTIPSGETPGETTIEPPELVEASVVEGPADQITAQAAAPEESQRYVAPSVPRRSLAEWFAAFMEEKNIRWGELIGGLLIVSCSTALVVSFWSTIAERLFLKYFVFNGVNAFMFLVGLHAARRWKLPTTSTGILLIACLLTPLNFLALSSFTQDGSAASGWVLIGELISLVVFAVLTYLAGRVVLPTIAIPFALAIMIPAGCELLVRRWIDASATLPPMYVVGGMVNLAYCLANAWTVRTLLGQRRWDESHCHDVWKMLGVSSFAAVLCLGMLLWKTRRVEELSAWLAPLGIVAAAPSLFMGQLVQRRVRRKTLAAQSVAGLSVALLGGLVLLAALVAAWPIPLMIMVCGVATWLMLTPIASLTRAAHFHAIALAALTAAYLAWFHVATGSLIWSGDQWHGVAEVLLVCAADRL